MLAFQILHLTFQPKKNCFIIHWKILRSLNYQVLFCQNISASLLVYYSEKKINSCLKWEHLQMTNSIVSRCWNLSLTFYHKLSTSMTLTEAV